MGNGITPLSQILYDLFFDMSLATIIGEIFAKKQGCRYLNISIIIPK
jgi:hypothetical protein